MSRFGGIGGIIGGRGYPPDNPFEEAVERVAGAAIRADYFEKGPDDGDRGCAVWGALANVVWLRIGGDSASYTFRAAGDLVAAIAGHGDYLTYYCNAEWEMVPSWFAEGMALEGWVPFDWDEVPDGGDEWGALG